MARLIGERVITCKTLEDWNEKFKAANESKKLIVINFFATWCQPCRSLDPNFGAMAWEHPNVIFFKIDFDEMHSIGEGFKVEALPTLLFMREGEVLDRVVGIKLAEIHQTLVKHVGRVASA